MSVQKPLLVSKLGALLVVGLFLVSGSPVMALAADEMIQPENVPVAESPAENPAVENVDEVETVVLDNLETSAEVASGETVETETVSDSDLKDASSEVTVETVDNSNATSTEPIEPAVTEAAEPNLVTAVEVMIAVDNSQVTAKSAPGSMAISDEFSGDTLNEDGENGDDGTNSQSGQGTFTTLPDGEVGEEVVSAESTFTTLSNGNGGADGDQVISAEHSFKTLGNGDTTEEGVSGENSFKTEANGGGGGGGGGDDDDDGGGGGGGGGHRKDKDELPGKCPLYLKKFIRLGYDNDPVEVRKLETFLRDFEGFDIPVNGIYEQIDFDAVSIFQARYRDAVLSPWGITDSTGYVYITTTLTINQIYCARTVGNNLDLRDVYSTFGVPLEDMEIVNLPTVTFAPAPAESNFFQLAAAGLLDFLKGLELSCWWLNWWLWLIVLILLGVIAYLIYRNRRLAKELANERELNEQAAIFAAPFTEEEEAEYNHFSDPTFVNEVEDEPSEVIELGAPKEDENGFK